MSVQYVWRVDTATYDAFRRDILELHKLQKKGETSAQLIEQIRSLPGFPLEADPAEDVIHIEWIRPVVSTPLH